MTIDLDNLLGGYSQDELEQAFKLVRPASHWKDPISAKVPADTNLDLLQFAVGYYTGSLAEISKADDGQFLVEADGYYATIGA